LNIKTQLIKALRTIHGILFARFSKKMRVWEGACGGRVLLLDISCKRRKKNERNYVVCFRGERAGRGKEEKDRKDQKE
jgi:hypothetical protein